MGSIYGFLAPSVELSRKAGQWESFDITLIGREVTESEVCNWIRQGRFVTLLRPGGIGETTVAVADGHDADVRLIAALVHVLKARH